jgi:hypothetical protein
MDAGHSAIFAALSVLNIPIHGWTCQVIDGVKNQNKWDPITAYTGTDPLTASASGFNGPYTMNFTVTDGGTPLNLIAAVTLNGTSTLTDAAGTALALPSNHNPQIDPGIDFTGSQVWYRWESGTNLRELRFHTPLNTSEVLAELEKIGLSWLGKLLPIITTLK